MADHDVAARPLLGPPAQLGADPTSMPLAPWRRILRSLSVSATTTGLSLSILALLIRTSLVTPATANVIATIAGIGPSFALNRRWAWQRDGKSHLRREVLPFWGYAMASLVVSTLAVARAAGWAEAADVSPTTRTIIVLVANLGSFAVLWCGQFVILDRVLSVASADARPLAERPADGQLSSDGR